MKALGRSAADEPAQAVREQQLVRADGTMLVSFLIAPGARVVWEPEPLMDIAGLCYGRIRNLPDGEWLVIACFPDGYPGPMQWPGELPAGSPEVRQICSYSFME